MAVAAKAIGRGQDVASGERCRRFDRGGNRMAGLAAGVAVRRRCGDSGCLDGHWFDGGRRTMARAAPIGQPGDVVGGDQRTVLGAGYGGMAIGVDPCGRGFRSGDGVDVAA